MKPLLFSLIIGLLTIQFNTVSAQIVTLTPSVSQTVSIGGTATDPVDGGSFVADEPYYVRERQASQPDSPLKTQLFFGFDLSEVDPRGILAAQLVIHQLDKLNGNAVEGFMSDLELSRVTEAWDTEGDNYPIFETTATEDAFIIGNNAQFGAPKNSKGFFGGDPNDPESDDGQIDVTEIVLRWLENPDTNHGFRLRMTDLSYTGATFSSLDNPATPENEAFRLIIEQKIEPSDKDKDADGLPDDWEIKHFGSVEAQGLGGDPDEDGASNRAENKNGTDPNEKDTDQDGIDDGPEIAAGLDPLVADADDDPDFDELTNQQEIENGTSPFNEDTDGDELLDGEEVANGTDPTRKDADEDLDGDGISNRTEILIDGTLANNPDTDGDGMDDGFEFTFFLDGLDPADAGSDVDEDGLTALEEFNAGTNPLIVDTDEDGLDDFKEVKEHMTNPLAPDSDGDGLTDLEEIEEYETNPNKPDTDGDGRSDSEEIAAGTDPNASETGVQFVVTELMPSVSQTVSMGGTVTDPVNGGVFIKGEPYYVRERMASEPTSKLKTQLFFGFDLSGIDPDKGIYSAELVIHQLDKLNGLDAPQNASDLELSRVTEAWDTDGNNYPIFETTTTEDAFIIGNNTQFGAPRTSKGYFSGDPNNPYSEDGLIDVTEIVLGWIKNPDTNHGFRLRMIHLSFTGATFSSVDSPEVGGNEALRLIITLAEPTDKDLDGDGLPDDWEIEHFGSVEAQGVVGDPDGDGLSNRGENENGTDPNEKDTDLDGIEDGPEIAAGLDPLVADADDDPDFDELTNQQEIENGTSPFNEDTDGDELLDGEEVANGTDPTRKDADEDLDGDGISNRTEILIDGTLANNPDTDGDGMDDGFEFEFFLDGLDPADAGSDVDEDGLTALEEFNAGTNPLIVDTDEDGLDDFKEVKEHMTNPLAPDSDGDGLTDLAEIEDHGTNPNEPDSDLDGFTDREEIVAGTDPNTAEEIQTTVTELTPSVSQTVSIGGTATDPVDGGSFVADEPYYVRERQASQPDSPLKTQLFFGFDLSGIDTGKRLLSARLVVHQMDKLNANADEGFMSDLELSRVTEAWDTEGDNYPIFETTATEDAFIIGNNTQFGAPKNSMGFFGGDPNNPESNDGQIDVTEIVLGWIKNPDANHGFRLRMTDLSYTGTTFSSLDNPETDGNEAFRLIITQSESTSMPGTELTPSVSQTVSIGGTATDPVDGGSFVADEPYYVRERQASQPDSPLKTQLFFGFDLSEVDTGKRLLSARLVVHQLDKLNGNADEGFMSDLELSRVTEAWDTEGDNYPIFETTATEDAFIIGNNAQFGAPKNSKGFFGGDPNDPESDDGQIDVTEIVLGWLENPDTNHGFRLRMTDLSFTGTTFSSLDNPETDGNEAFRLIITQSNETEIPIAEFLTVGFNGSKSDPVSVGAWGASGELFVRERRPNDAAERVKTHLYIRFDLSGLNPDNAILKAHLKIFQIHRLNSVAANIGNLAVGRVIEPWDQDGENYPTYLSSEVADEFLFGRNDDFGTAANAMGFYGGDPENQADDDGLVDVTIIVQQWFTGAADNNGFRLQMVDPEFSAVAFAQTDNPDTPEDEELVLIISQGEWEGFGVPGEAFGVAIALNSVTGEVTLSWSAEEGKTYRIEAKSDLGSGEWMTIATVAEGNYTAAASEAAQFYRIVEE